MAIGTTLLILALVVLALLALSGIRFIPNNRVGIVEKRFGAKSVKTGFIALKGEAGFQPKLLRGGLHYRMPIQYLVHRSPLVTITQGKIGYVFARDGHPLEPMQVLASNVTANDFQDVAAFLENGGQRGPQRQILREGTYAINLAQFIVITEESVYYLPLNRAEEGVIQNMAKVIGERDGFRPVVLKDQDDKTGIVTVHDGPSLSPGEIIAPSLLMPTTRRPSSCGASTARYWPLRFSSATRTVSTSASARASARRGTGKSVCGWNRETRLPSRRSAATACRAARAVMP